jgi:hypothetical protein
MATFENLEYIKLSASKTKLLFPSGTSVMTAYMASSFTSSLPLSPPKLKVSKPSQEILQTNDQRQVSQVNQTQHAAAKLIVSARHFFEAPFGINSRKQNKEERKGKDIITKY